MREHKYFRHFQTPPEVCELMAYMIPVTAQIILEPTPGIGNLKRAIQSRGFKVTAPKDFFLMGHRKFDAVVMNPPFSKLYTDMRNAPKGITGLGIGYYFLEQATTMSDTVIALMPWYTVLDSDLRMRRMVDFGLKSITSLPRKTFRYARVQTAVFHMIKGWNRTTEFKAFDY